MDGLINLVEESYIFHVTQPEYVFILQLLKIYYEKIGIVFIPV